MKRLIFLALIFVALSSSLYAQDVCKNPSGNKIPLACSATGGITIGAFSPATGATFAAQTVVGFAAIGAAYGLAVDLPDETRSVILDNQTNGDVQVSMNGGTSDTFHIKGGDVLSIPLASLGLVTTGAVHLKDGTSASTAGSFYIYSIK